MADTATATPTATPTGATIDGDLRKLLDAIRLVESGGVPNEGTEATGDTGKALGPYQIWKSYWQDAYDKDKSLGGVYEDVKKKDYAERVIVAYWKRYCSAALGDPTTLDNKEILARVHNGGPKGATKSGTLNYWTKVKGVLAP